MQLAPILVAERFPALRKKLIELLRSLAPDEWSLRTAAGHWSVKDVAAHLLGGDVYILSNRRDGFRLSADITSHADLIELVNRLNAEWVTAFRRMSPQLLIEFLELTGPQVESIFAAMDPMAMGDPVTWAGPDPAPQWLDIAREFTERWHHQQQIRDATKREPIYDPYFMAPVLDAFVRSLPYNFRGVPAPSGTIVRFQISGESGGVWELRRTSSAWNLFQSSSDEATTEVILPQDIAWRLFTKGIDRGEARASAVVEGDEALSQPIFAATAIIG